MKATAAERFERMVDRTGEHHLWQGALHPARGTGRLKVDGRQVTAHRHAWELAHGPLAPKVRVLACPHEPACVRVDHLELDGELPEAVDSPSSGRRNYKGGGSKRQIAPGVWKLTATIRDAATGTTSRQYRTVRCASASEADQELAAFVIELRREGTVDRRTTSLTLDEAVERYLTEHLLEERGREPRTADDYRRLHHLWFAPHIGTKPLRDVDEADIDRAFGRMRSAGLSRSRMNQARSLYAPLFRWARRRRMVVRDPLRGFELPTSKHVSTSITPPEVEELAILLSEAIVVIPDVAPLLVVGSVTGMRRGELVGVRRSRIHWKELEITVDVAMDGDRVKTTKTRTKRRFSVDEQTMAMLARLLDEHALRAAEAGAELCADPFVFSATLDCSAPLSGDYVTKRVALLKEHLGIEQKRPETVQREDEALRLFRGQRPARPAGKRGPAPRGALSFAEIGARFDRSERWAAMAVAAAERREEAVASGRDLDFDGSVLALRKFTSSELLDAGFNISMVAQRQGHGTQVLAKHYAKSRRSADRKAAQHLGLVVHGTA